MAEHVGLDGKVVINLATGLEDPERVTVAFLVGGAAAEQGRNVVAFLTKEAVRLGVAGTAEAVACDGCPPLAQLFQQYADAGGQLVRNCGQRLRRLARAAARSCCSRARPESARPSSRVTCFRARTSPCSRVPGCRAARRPIGR